ncbi:hypothetical protein TVAG_148900 [Trichomonas vaginalis G3]|uniref:C2 domain-containing protein n=1 Tax=Trichomonas vaginalis (strain ATCC PRA-98 / G3) TaxID=412133 RepID=A2FEN5_TRIV3|nr:hypothetical protein TVAGG3_0375460 [Trichomonas vaginalis G3]EAX96615.1 hypothetical protein TVAG_148900 [Trichomonas vaginalis G3]KAI5532910.1 hypothetical protein TVAGG3_0375460 [Trichomonas vaginalis G3]|eukprot:XP_001309545.1 hypothetical protein [Trichomonas vaginalis G3]
MSKMKKVYIQVRSIDLGSYAATDKAELILCVGPRHNFQPFSYALKAGEKHHINHTWEFHFKHEEDSSFVVVLFKHHFLGDKEIGELEFLISGFQPNTVVSDKFVLQSANEEAFPAEIEMSIHVDEDGAPPFHAPEGFLFEGATKKHNHIYGVPENKIAN